MLPSRTVRLGSILVGSAYALFSLAAIPAIVTAPAAYVSYGNFFEHFAVVCGAIAGYARRAARLGLGVCTISFALAQIAYLNFTASLVPAWIPPNQMFWAVFTTISFAFAAVAMLLNLRARLAIQMMAAMLALFGALVWVPHIIAHPTALGNWSEFAVNYLIAGAAWMVAEVTSWVPRDASAAQTASSA